MGRRLTGCREFRGGQGLRWSGGKDAHLFEENFSRVAGEDGGENAERQGDKQNAEEQPADEKFPGAIGIRAKAQEQQGELCRNKSFTQGRRKTIERDRHEMEDRIDCEKRKDGEMTDTGRPAQTGQYHSVPPSRVNPSEYRKGGLYTIAQSSKFPQTPQVKEKWTGVCKSGRLGD
jgi:hypothetical protein